jgi:hypothetical protein
VDKKMKRDRKIVEASKADWKKQRRKHNCGSLFLEARSGSGFCVNVNIQEL